MSGSAVPHLALDDPAGIEAFGRALTTAGFTSDAVRAALGIEVSETIPISEIPAVVRMLPPAPVSTIIKSFLFGLPVEESEFARVVPEPGVDRLQAMGVVRKDSGRIQAQVRLRPYGKFVFASDRRYTVSEGMPADYVLEVNPTSDHLAKITPRRRVGTALDLGCGCGVLSVIAGTHSGRVVGTDINSRALNFTAFNARLNGIANVETLEGSLFEPVRGKTFDLVMSNPPFVVSPDRELQFRDSGWPLDTFCREVIRSAPAHLNEGGIAVFLCNWVLLKGQEWIARPSEWIADLGCDAMLFRTATHSPEEYAANWNRTLAGPEPEKYKETLDRWIGFFREQNVAAIGAGRLVLRRRSAPRNWAHAVDGAVGSSEGSGEQILRMIEAQDWMSTSPDFLEVAFVPAPDFTLDQTMGYRDGRMVPLQLSAMQRQGFQLKAAVDPLSWHALAALDGRRTLRQIAESEAKDAGIAASQVADKIVPVFRGLLAGGHIVRA